MREPKRRFFDFDLGLPTPTVIGAESVVVGDIRGTGQFVVSGVVHGDGEIAVLRPGRYVVCAVTGKKIPLEALRYWNPRLQEAYAGPAEALTRWRELNPRA